MDFDSSRNQRRQYRKLISPLLSSEQELVNKIQERRQRAEMVSRDWIIAEAKRIIASHSLKAQLVGFPILSRDGESQEDYQNQSYKNSGLIIQEKFESTLKESGASVMTVRSERELT